MLTHSKHKPLVPLIFVRAYSDTLCRFIEGDRVLLQPTKSDLRSILSKPLRRTRSTPVHHGSIAHENIIGRQHRETVTSSGREQYYLTVPTLDEYVKLTPRRVTPIYPNDANLIVSKLDIHVNPSELNEDKERLEILEAGTGHGALSIYIARAIHAANPPVPQPEDTKAEHCSDQGQPEHQSDDSLHAKSDWDAFPAPFPEKWRDRRGAVLHTVDVSPLNTLHARKIVNGFRRGMYAGNVDFYVDDVSTWIIKQQTSRFDKQDAEKTFLAHIFLDMPDCHKAIHHASSALKTDGKLLVFSPSVTQILTCVNKIKDEKLPLSQDAVLEIGSVTSGGRPWEVKALSPRTTKSPSIKVTGLTDNEDVRDGVERSLFSKSICRPQIGPTMVNGGFLGIWSKMR